MREITTIFEERFPTLQYFTEEIYWEECDNVFVCLKNNHVLVDTRGACGQYSAINLGNISVAERKKRDDFRTFMEDVTSNLGTYVYW